MIRSTSCSTGARLSFAARKSLAPRSHGHPEATGMTGGEVGNAGQLHHQAELLRIELIQPKCKVFHQGVVDEPGGLSHISERLPQLRGSILTYVKVIEENRALVRIGKP